LDEWKSRYSNIESSLISSEVKKKFEKKIFLYS
jgi:HKD family nuclease